MAALFSNILTASFHGSIVIAAVLVLRLILKKAPRKYICYLWLLAGLRLLMPFQIQSELSLQPAAPPERAIRWEQPAPMTLPEQDQGTPADLSSDVPEAVSTEGDAETPMAVSEPSRTWENLIPLLWCAVAAVFLAGSFLSYGALRKKVRGARPIAGGWEADQIETAFILGFVRPQIYIPTGMTEGVRKHILAHERTHLDKGDHWVKMIGYLALCLHWFNPLVWVAYTLLCKDIEMACDERVVQFMDLPERKAYSAALLSCSNNRIHYAASPVAFGEVSVKSRILSILNYRKPSFWMGLLSVAAIAFVAVCLVTSPTQTEEAAQGAVPEDNSGYLEPADLPEEEDPGWGLSLVAEPLSPTTMNLYYGVGVEGIPWDGTDIFKDSPYWIQRWNGEEWEDLPQKVASPTYEGSAVLLSLENTHGTYLYDSLDWSLLYGPLPQGDYRICIRPTRNGQTKAHYASFHIYANTLTGEAAQAVERCETALDRLLGGSYTCTVLESNEFGNLLPVMKVTKDREAGRIDSYYGDLCYSSLSFSVSDRLMTTWDDAFRTDENKFISFPEGESRISDEQIRFLSTWTDVNGVDYRQYNTYTFDEGGNLTEIDRLLQWEEDGTTVQSQRTLRTGQAETADPQREPRDAWEAAEDSPWKIFFRVDDDYLKPTGGEVWMGLSHTVGLSNYTTDGSYWLEKYTGDGWEALSAQGEASWGTDTYRLKSTNIMQTVDWTDFYGALDPGLYRMGKHFYKADETTVQYAEFKINPQGGLEGEGAADALARIEQAVEELCAGNYHITETSLWGAIRQKEQVTGAYWKYDGLCVTDFYNVLGKDGYSHSLVCDRDNPNTEAFYDGWTNLFNWNDDNMQVLFPEGASLITQDRIVFATSYTGGSSLLKCYDIRFDQAGKLQSVIFRYRDLYSGTLAPITLKVEDTSEEEIRAWVTEQQAQS